MTIQERIMLSGKKEIGNRHLFIKLLTQVLASYYLFVSK